MGGKQVVMRMMKVFKYIFVFVVAVLMVGFADENSLYNHYRNAKKIYSLEQEIASYRDAYKRDKEMLRQLDEEPKALERIAREKYFMRKADEDVFVLSDEGYDIAGGGK